MRQILVDHARAQKRGADRTVYLDTSHALQPAPNLDVTQVDDAHTALAKLGERQVQIASCASSAA